MSDFLVRLGKNNAARWGVKTFGLPIPLPQDLDRADCPWEAEPLAGKPVIIGAGHDAALCTPIGQAIAEAGAEVWVDHCEEVVQAVKEDGAPPHKLTKNAPEDLRPHGLVFDATGLDSPEDLRKVYNFFQPWIKKLRPCGRVIVLGRPFESAKSPAESATQRALEGFIKSVGREVGKKGSTALVFHVEPGAEKRVEAVLRFALSNRSAYVSGQPLHISNTIKEYPTPVFEQPLNGKNALVTGAARGIGEAIARALAREGAKVICMDRPSEEESLRKVVEKIHGTAFPCDITDSDAPRKAAEFVKEHGGGLDIVIHNAGVTRDKMLGNMDADRWDMVLNVNLISLIALNEGLLETLNDNGRIVCLSSIGGIAGNIGQTNYAASKAGVIGYIKALSKVVADRGITVNAIAPGFIETQMTAQIPVATREVARRLCNLAQGGQPEDVAEVITFLASPGAAGMTGEVVRVCGGNYVGA